MADKFDDFNDISSSSIDDFDNFVEDEYIKEENKNFENLVNDEVLEENIEQPNTNNTNDDIQEDPQEETIFEDDNKQTNKSSKKGHKAAPVDNGNNTGVVTKSVEQVIHESMLPYSEFVIMDRALPRVEDGLKPVQRRVLYSMLEVGVLPDRPFRKSARIVGDCMGKYHPHGDRSIYDTMVRLAQDFNMGEVLVSGHGNFGSVDGDSAAAMR